MRDTNRRAVTSSASGFVSACQYGSVYHTLGIFARTLCAYAWRLCGEGFLLFVVSLWKLIWVTKPFQLPDHQTSDLWWNTGRTMPRNRDTASSPAATTAFRASGWRTSTAAVSHSAAATAKFWYKGINPCSSECGCLRYGAARNGNCEKGRPFYQG